jgi:SAM-dependent methyltransferase
MNEILRTLFTDSVELNGNLIILKSSSEFTDQQQTINVFSDKWSKNDVKETIDDLQSFQLRWYIDLYGFKDENDFANFLKTKRIILDAGCGLGYKAAWFASLSPESTVIGMDLSDAVLSAADFYKGIKNLFFVKGDIANTGIKKNRVDYISCDQVIHHTEFPESTFAHFTELLTDNGQIACYVYAKKALPRELLDEYFRSFCKQCTKEQLWEMSEQLTLLGKTLSDLKINIEVPDIPLLGIKGGTLDIQRFLYWNFLKCFWNEELSWNHNVVINYDWYAPSNAKRYSEEDFKLWAEYNKLEIAFFHKEEACYSGRFIKIKESE